MDHTTRHCAGTDNLEVLSSKNDRNDTPISTSSGTRPFYVCFDAKYMKGGQSAWKAIGVRIQLYT